MPSSALCPDRTIYDSSGLPATIFIITVARAAVISIQALAPFQLSCVDSLILASPIQQSLCSLLQARVKKSLLRCRRNLVRQSLTTAEASQQPSSTFRVV